MRPHSTSACDPKETCVELAAYRLMVLLQKHPGLPTGQVCAAQAEARSLSDVAVQLRRVSARLEDSDDMSRTMLASALAVVEAT